MDKHMVGDCVSQTYFSSTGLQIYGGRGSLSHDFKNGPLLSKANPFSCEKFSL